jgi:hypothetical protein
LSLAFAETVTAVPETVALLAGADMVTVGAVESNVVMVTAALVVRLPAASRARADNVWVPGVTAVVFQDLEYGAAVSSVPSEAPSKRNCTPATATLSLAVAETVTVPVRLAPLAGAVIETVGAVVSFAIVTVTTVVVVWLPAASRARADKVCVPFATVALFQEIEYGDTVSSVPSAAPSRRNCTPTTPTLSLAVADTVTFPDTVALFTGADINTVGGVVSVPDPWVLKFHDTFVVMGLPDESFTPLRPPVITVWYEVSEFRGFAGVITALELPELYAMVEVTGFPRESKNLTVADVTVAGSICLSKVAVTVVDVAAPVEPDVGETEVIVGPKAPPTLDMNTTSTQ